MAITLRRDKGAHLTFTEHDDNFAELDNRRAWGGMVDTSWAFTSIGAAWTPLVDYETEQPTARTMAVDLAAGTILFPYPGVYRLTLRLNFQHNESNQSRETNIRLFNVTDGTQTGPGLIVPIARNQSASLITAVSPFELGGGDLGDAIRLEIGNGDTISSIANVSLVYFAEYAGASN